MNEKAKSLLESLVAQAVEAKKVERNRKAAERTAARTRARLTNGTLSGSESLKTLFSASNIAVADWHTEPGWRARERLTYIVEERCDTCHNTVRYIGNEFTVYTRVTAGALHTRRLSPELITRDENGMPLPRMKEIVQRSVHECATCLLAEDHISQLVDLALEVAPHSRRQSDFFGPPKPERAPPLPFFYIRPKDDKPSDSVQEKESQS